MKGGIGHLAVSKDETPLVVGSAADLRLLRDLPARSTRRPLTVRLPGFSVGEAEAVTAQLNGLRRECGCSLGAKFMAVGFLTVLGVLFFWQGLSWRFVAWSPLALIAALVNAGVGKFIGIRRARWRWRQQLDRLMRRAMHTTHGEETHAR